MVRHSLHLKCNRGEGGVFDHEPPVLLAQPYNKPYSAQIYIYMYVYVCVCNIYMHRASQVALVEKNRPVNAGDARDAILIPGLGRSPEVGNGNHSIILAWKIPWTEEWQATWNCKGSDATERPSTHMLIRNLPASA